MCILVIILSTWILLSKVQCFVNLVLCSEGFALCFIIIIIDFATADIARLMGIDHDGVQLLCFC